jgi:hypothetical protein
VEKAVYAGFSGNPNAAIMTCGKAPDSIVTKAGIGGEEGLLTSVPAQGTARSADPQGMLGVLSQRDAVVTGQKRRVRPVKTSESNAIETGKPSMRGQPEIPIMRLNNGLNSVFGKTILHFPLSPVIAISERTRARQVSGFLAAGKQKRM